MTAAVQLQCELCGLDCGRHPLTTRFGADEHSFCCAGCVNVYAILRESGVIAAGQDFRQTEVYRQSLRLGLISNRAPEPEAAGIPENAETREAIFQLSGMWCTSCAWLIERALRKQRGVVSADVFFASDLVKVRYCPVYLPRERIPAAIAGLGYGAAEYSGRDEHEGAETRDLLLRIGVAAFLWLNVMSLSLVLYAGYFERISDSAARRLPFVLLALASGSVFYAAQPVLRAAWIGLRNRAVRMESLLAIGILAAYGYSAAQAFAHGKHFYFDTTCALIALVLTGKLAERGAKDKTARAITTLYRMMPNKVRLLADGSERFVSIDALEAGAIFVVKAGERIPADGTVEEGVSHVDESVLTGESVPRRKAAGDPVVCGSLNADSVLQVRATRIGADSTLAHVIRLVETALANHSPLEQAVDRAARIFVPAVMAAAALTFAGWTWAGSSPATALLRAITVLVIACPCALGMATPLAITTAIGAASRKGILVSSSRALEVLPKVGVMVFDKTGTVTEGDFRLLEVSGDRAVLPAAAALETRSEHPLGRALVEWAGRQGGAAEAPREVEVVQGAGIRGRVGGRDVFVGNRRLAGSVPPDLEAKVRDWERQGHTVAFYGSEGRALGALAFGDRIKDGAPELIASLKRRGIRTLLLSGDAAATTAWVAARIGADAFIAGALPEQKIETIRDLQRQGSVVAMIGDGVNDAPSLAQADAGIALGTGADIAMQAAPIILMGSGLDAVLPAIDLARHTIRAIRQNLFWAFAYNTAGIALAVAGVLNPIFAAGAMVLSSLSVTANSLRLGRRL
ncbi:MAG TPA: heavy metal translocating P-type ATPase [Bryobacteraceae bacterium]|nr:heavy metal translocating P-type ATPase [Bryobacteraceae bacterium]